MNRQLQYAAGLAYQDIIIDSQKVYIDSTIIYFNPRIYNNNCYNDSVINTMFYQNYLFLVPDKAVIYPNQTKFICKRGSKTKQLTFKQNASPGDTWNIGQSGLYFKCDSLTTKNVFDSIDSVKYFSVYLTPSSTPFENIGFVLSKNSGLLKFSSIPKLAYGEHDSDGSSLIGYRENGDKKGNIIPEFKDFFHLNKSDVLIWKVLEKDIDIRIPDVIYYYKDSIISAIHTKDSVKYKFLRTLNATQTLDSVRYERSQIEPFLKINPTNNIYSDTDPLSHSIDLEYKHWDISDLTLTKTTCSITSDWSGYSHSKTTCLENIMTDVGKSFTINNNVGLSSYSTYGWGSTTTEVIGSIIDGVHLGITSIPTSISNINYNHFNIYPNPAENVVYVDGDFKINSFYKIYNFQGKLVQSGELTNQINIEYLNEGLYHVQIENENSVLHSTFVKH